MPLSKEETFHVEEYKSLREDGGTGRRDMTKRPKEAAPRPSGHDRTRARASVMAKSGEGSTLCGQS
jgi:hypothetical protein